MKIQAKWFAMIGAAAIGALLLVSLFGGSTRWRKAAQRRRQWLCRT